MAMPVSYRTLGFDVAKDEFAVCEYPQRDEIFTLSNERAAIKRFLKTLAGSVRLAVEPTSIYHCVLVEEALKLGIEVYLINPRHLVHYRKAVNETHKTDPADAFLLARYLEHEVDHLRPFQPADRRAEALWALLKRRAKLAITHNKLRQSFKGVNMSCRGVLREIESLMERIDTRMTKLIKELGWWSDHERCRSIPGIGPMNAVALTVAYHRYAFASANAFVSFIGFDVRIRESGKYKGRSKLTKEGHAELRRLLYCAAQGRAKDDPGFARYYHQQIGNGHSKIAANVALARKLARIAFTLIASQSNFEKTTV